MQVIATSNDPVRLSFLLSLLADAGIRPFLLDDNASRIDGSIGAVPRRIAVADDKEQLARQVLAEAGEATDG